MLFPAPRFWCRPRPGPPPCQEWHEDPGLPLEALGVCPGQGPQAASSPTDSPHCGGAVISSPHGAAQWEEAESSVLLYILKVKCLKIMLMDASKDR